MYKKKKKYKKKIFKNNKKIIKFLSLLVVFFLVIIGFWYLFGDETKLILDETYSEYINYDDEIYSNYNFEDYAIDGSNLSTTATTETTVNNLSDIPEYSGEIYIYINDNIPYFEDSEITTEVFEIYSELDDLGRCGVAYANICTELMPTEDRDSISSVTPTGWVQAKYDGEYLYNRCHLIGYQLAR